MKLRCISYNCESFLRNTEFVEILLSSCDVLLLQETLVTDHSINSYSIFDKEWKYIAVPAERNNLNFYGRSSGGLVIYYRKVYAKYIKPFYSTSRLMGARLCFDQSNVLLLNIYCPCDYRNAESFSLYQATMAELISVCESEKFDSVVVAGDFNCDPRRGRFYSLFSEMINYLSLSAVDIDRLSLGTYSYISRNEGCSTSWLDHVVSSNPNLVKDVEIIYGLSLEDHLPLVFSLYLESSFNPLLEPQADYFRNNHHPCIAWDRVVEEHIELYNQRLDVLLGDFVNHVSVCSEKVCNNSEHRVDLEHCYDHVINCIFLASEELPRINPKQIFRQRVGWNSNCKNLYAIAREKYLIWNNEDRPRFGKEFEEMKSSRKIFRNMLNYCKKNELRIKKANITKSFQTKKSFWRKIRSTNGKRVIPSCIEGETEPERIIDIFDRKYKSILDGDSLRNVSPEFCEEFSYFNGDVNVFDSTIRFEEFQDAFKNLNKGKGWDGIHSHHLRYASCSVRYFIYRLFSQFISHSFLPCKMLKGEIKPVIKNVHESNSDMKNYRPVMNSSYFLKLFEYMLLPKLEDSFVPHFNQFGFRKNTSCLNTITILKETVLTYHKEKSNVHCAKIDLSKAFDKVNHYKLLSKMIDKKIAPSIIRVIFYMLTNTEACVNFNGFKGQFWRVGSGVRQGGILSPLLFNLYLNEVLENISKINVGCFLANRPVNIMCYADDIILCAPSKNGLQFLIDETCKILDANNLPLNDKSEYIIFKHRQVNHIKYSIMIKGITFENIKETKYLGAILSSDFKIHKDVDRSCFSFLKQFNAVFHKFSFLSRDVIAFLVQSYCMSLYGCDLWYDYKNIRVFHGFAVAYHKALKRLAGLAPWDSNHRACEILNFPIFIHNVNNRLISYLFSLVHSKSPCLVTLRYYLRYSSFFMSNVSNIFRNQYGVINILQNDLAALKSRIDFVQRNEERSFYVP